VLADINKGNLDAAVARLREGGVLVEGVVIDVADAAALKEAIDGTVARHGRLDVMFANAGITAGPGIGAGPEGWLENVDPDAWARVLDVNLTAQLNTMKFAAPHMKTQGCGRIVVNASIGGLRSEQMVSYSYAATKAALINVVRHAARELAPFNVQVNAIAPGPFRTNIAGGRMYRDPEIVEQFVAMVPLGRVAHPDEIKGLALLLAAPLTGSFITGTVIPIDGGITAG